MYPGRGEKALDQGTPRGMFVADDVCFAINRDFVLKGIRHPWPLRRLGARAPGQPLELIPSGKSRRIDFAVDRRPREAASA